MSYRPRSPIPVDEITTKGHIFVGVEWTATGSKGEAYTITMHPKGFTCECMAFERRGLRCKHIDAVVKGIVGTEEIEDVE
jgi:hypothetical protein